MAFSTINLVMRSEHHKAYSIVESAFSDKPTLRARILEVVGETSSPLKDLFHEVAAYILELKTARSGIEEEPATKKRKLNEELQVNGKTSKAGNDATILNESWSGQVFEGISFSVPQRKKLFLEISSKRSEGIRALNPSTKETEFGIPWKEIDHVVCLPVPEKAQPARNFCVFPKNGDGISSTQESAAGYEPVVWTVQDTKNKGGSENDPLPSETMKQAFKNAKAKVLEPEDSEFASQLQQAMRKGEKAYHVKAFRGSKDGKSFAALLNIFCDELTMDTIGFLFFLSEGIVWGFKKPLIFFAFSSIDSISYTSVLQRTFNLNIAARPTPTSDPQDFEFSMVDQADFAGIDGYVKRHGLQDASMAEERRAKKLNINGKKGEEAEEEDGEGELAKAHREAEMQADDDDDEEDDENFDPGSEGESEGSGTNDEEDGPGDGGGPGDQDADLVREELGSEVEEVETEEE